MKRKMDMKTLLEKYAVMACTALFIFAAAMPAHGQASPNTTTSTSRDIAPNTGALREQLRARYDIVALEDGVGLVPRRSNSDTRLIEVRNGVVAINGNPVTAAEARARLGQDADLILRVTYLDAAAQKELAGASSGGSSPGANAPANTGGEEEAPSGRSQMHRGDLVHIGGGISVARDEVVDGDAVAIGGSADIDGQVNRDVTVVGGSLNLGPEAVVRGDVAVIGGSLHRQPGARIDGKVANVGFGGRFPWNRPPGGPRFLSLAPFLRVGGLIGTLVRVGLLILCALVVVALGGRFVEAIADRAATEPFRSGLAGLLAEVLFVPLVILTVVVLAISIIGIPLLVLVPFGMVLAVVPMLGGFTGVAYQIGRWASGRFGSKTGAYGSVALGVVVVVGITIIARLLALAGGFLFGLVIAGPLAAIGGLAEYVAWTIGIGAVLLTWLSTRRHMTPPAAVAAGPATDEPHAG